MHDDDVGADLCCHLDALVELGPRIRSPHSLGDEQTWRMYRADWHLVVVGQVPDGIDVLADRVDSHHDLDRFVPELDGQLERPRARLRVHRGRRQRDPRRGHLNR
jgi:hypothetical protein